MRRNEISPELVRDLLRYDPESGKLFWRPRTPALFGGDAARARTSADAWNARFAGKEAFTATSNGYRQGGIANIIFRAHQVIWAICYGDWPHGVDHINGDRADNRLINLREVSQADNMRNRRRGKNNSSGVVGVYWNSQISQWIAQICVDGSRSTLGCFDRIEEAASARKAAEVESGFHLNHGRA